MNLKQIDDSIRKRFHVHRNDVPPYCGWKKNPDSNRLDLAKLFGELKYTKGAEIGVCKAENAVVLFDNIPELQLICVDPWTAYSAARSEEQCQARYEIAMKELKGRNAIIKRMTSVEASFEIDDNSLDFVYIDGMHNFDAVMLDLIHWTKKVKIGGMISLHDYGATCRGVQRAVDSYMFGHGIADLYMTREMKEVPSCFWINRR